VGQEAWANPDLQIAFGHTPNLCSLEHFDSLEAALSRAVITCATRSIFGVRARCGSHRADGCPSLLVFRTPSEAPNTRCLGSRFSMIRVLVERL
jgi:hypothetical protein